MSRPSFKNTVAFAAAMVICSTGAMARNASGAQPEDYVQAKTTWKGEIRQGGAAFPTVISVSERTGDRIKGEINFTVNGGARKLTFQGTVLDGRNVAWITDKKEGAVTFPGLYLGKVTGKTIAGVWEVPSANQYDRFMVQLVE